MPKTRRDLIKRKLAQAYINLNWSGTYIKEIHDVFSDHHPELAEILYLANEGIYHVQQLIETFAILAYEKENPDWQAWAATGRPRHE